ncbi:probable disease resistance protein At5g47260 [Vicia villosa]|uniref:probable disease resistance protein At5g47260 n=1 Tax=Vicia villosa TaxID=3911 RepID=UPI00273C24FC|nr:probable disease resistance protein At5g47260 [Vicia villosa]
MSKILRRMVDKNCVPTWMIVDNHNVFQDLTDSLEFECQTEMMYDTLARYQQEFMGKFEVVITTWCNGMSSYTQLNVSSMRRCAPPFPSVVTKSSKNTDRSKFDDKIKKQMMDALRVRDQGINIIGLCGPHKMVEAFVKTVIRKAERDQLFEKIVTATVTMKSYITNIQTQIGDAIGLNFDDKTDLAESTCCTCVGYSKRMRTAERAHLLCAKLKELQSVLVVLYDLHGRLDLGEIGIPFGEDHNGCKILLASTNLEVLSKEMKVHKLIQLSET